MKLYLDDDSAAPLLAQLLQQAGHDVQRPNDVGLDGADDPVHLTHAIKEMRTLLTRNYRDFELLHDLVMAAQGHHPGLLIVRRDNDPSRNLKPRDIVRAVANLLAAGIPIADQYIVLNHWR
jgi:hypothetical protein